MLASVLGLVFAASMGVSAVHATEMAAGMTITSAMGAAASDGKCPHCDHGSRDMNAMDCRLAVCGALGVATLASAPVLVVQANGLALPILAQSSLVGWAHPPDPYPPRPCTLG